MAAMTAALRPRRRPAKRGFVRPRRRRTRKEAWAFVPTGGTLESRLRRLLSGCAEDVVREELRPPPIPVDSNVSEDAEPGCSKEQAALHGLGLVASGEMPAGAEDATPSKAADTAFVETAAEERGETGYDPSEDGAAIRYVSQELPLVTSQMSEGLEILLLASQESVGDDDSNVHALCARTERAARKLWKQLPDPYENSILAGEGLQELE